MYLPPLLFDDTLGSKYNNITKIIFEIHNFLLSTFPERKRKDIKIKSRIGNQKSKQERKDNANGESESFSLKKKKSIAIYFEPCGFVQLIFEIKFGNLAVTIVIFHCTFLLMRNSC